MPEVSRFLGVVISVYFKDTPGHQAPHFHAYYGEYAAAYSIPDGEVIVGGLPRKKDAAVRVWAELRERELAEAWENAAAGRPVAKIAPLR